MRAASDCRLLVLSREAFTRILGSIKHYLKEDYKMVDVMETVVEDDDVIIQEAHWKQYLKIYLQVKMDYRTFYPKYVTYRGDGSGRDHYIISINGGLHE